jgi:hypothetical protein
LGSSSIIFDANDRRSTGSTLTMVSRYGYGYGYGNSNANGNANGSG